MSLDLDIGTKLNNAFILNYKTNCDEPIALFINKMLSELSQKDIDIVEIVDNFALSMTDETTALDFVDFMANELGFATDDMVQFFNTEINIAK